MDEPITRWWWVRHAPVPDSGRIYGQEDLDCDCSAEDVFGALAHTLPHDAVWLTSNLRRTHQTAAAIMAAVNGRHAENKPIEVPNFAEQHLGEWQGLVRKEFHAARKPRHSFWLAPAHERAPGGESFHDLYDRVAPEIRRFTTEHNGRDIIAVTHGGTIKAALALALDVEPEVALAFSIENCSVTRLDHLGEHASREWRIISVNHRPWHGAVAAQDLNRAVRSVAGA